MLNFDCSSDVCYSYLSLEEIRNDPALQELKGEVAELTARIDELVARGAEESAEAEEAEPADDAALGEI